MKLLHIDSSITGQASLSRQLTAHIVDQFRAAAPELTVLRRDLDAAPLAHLDQKQLAAAFAGNSPDLETEKALQTNASVLAEFQDANIVVIGAPMYNFSIPSQLKAWIDRVMVAGKTFRYTEKGPEGLAGGKKIIIASTRGGVYEAGTPYAAIDFQEAYLRGVFQFLGVTDIQIVRAEGVSMGPAQRDAALAKAIETIPAIAQSATSTLAA